MSCPEIEQEPYVCGHESQAEALRTIVLRFVAECAGWEESHPADSLPPMCDALRREILSALGYH